MICAMETVVIERSMPATTEKPELSIIIPAYNEERSIEKTVRKTIDALGELTDNYELIIVDDGSKDKTLDELTQFTLNYKKTRIRVIKNGENVGKGFAVKHAAEYSTGKTVVLLDADMEINPSQIKMYVEWLKYYDICIASKRHPRSVYQAPFIRKVMSLAFNKLVNLFVGLNLSDTQSGLKAMCGDDFKRIMNAIVVKRYAYDVEVLAVAKLLNLSVCELPVNIEQNSNFKLRSIISMFMEVLGIAYRLRIIKWYQKNLMKSSGFFPK
jgi:dolichol-phosphate mannosyltransferase